MHPTTPPSNRHSAPADQGPDQQPGTEASDLAVWDQAVAAARVYLRSLSDAGPVGPTEGEIAALASFDGDYLDDPLSPQDALQKLDVVGSPATMRSAGGRYFGFVNGGTHPAARAAAVLAGAWDQNAALAAMSPVASRIDDVTARWVIDLLGLPSTSIASFCGGATVANLTGIITARDELLRRHGWDVASRGLFGAPPITVIAGSETHISALKALRLAGFGTDQIIEVASDELGRMRADGLDEALNGLDDRAKQAGVLLLGQAGNVNTGASDPFAELFDVAETHLDRSAFWVHVDGAFGLWASAAPERRHINVGVERADSWATDAHKFANTPYDCGVLICAQPEALRRSMIMSAAYVVTDDDARDPMSIGIQMSQAARAVPLWAVLATEGRAGMAARIEQACMQADDLARRLVAGGAELLAPVMLNQALVSFGENTDAVVEAVQRSQACWVGPTTWQGRRAMRLSVSSFATTDADIESSAEAVLSAAGSVG